MRNKHKRQKQNTAPEPAQKKNTLKIEGYQILIFQRKLNKSMATEKWRLWTDVQSCAVCCSCISMIYQQKWLQD